MLCNELAKLAPLVTIGAFGPVTVGNSPTPLLPGNSFRWALYCKYISGNGCYVSPDANINGTSGIGFFARTDVLDKRFKDWGAAVQLPWFGIALAGPTILYVLEIVINCGDTD